MRYLILAFACSTHFLFAAEVNVYSHRHYEADQMLFDQFTAKTGIKVNIVKAGADALIKRLKIEGDKSPADILITADAGLLHIAKEEGVLQAVKSDILEKSIPSHLRDPESYWFGLTTRVRVVVFAKDRVSAADVPSYESLTDKKWKGKILVRSSTNVYNQSLLASVIAHKGKAEAEIWAKGIVANMAHAPKGNDRDQVKDVVAGIGDLAIINTYYLGLLLNSPNPEEQKVGQAVGICFPKLAGAGTHINVSGAGITKSSKNIDNAIKLLEFLVSDESQRIFAEANYEYPVKPGVRWSDLLNAWGDFTPDTINLSKLGELNRDAVRVFQTADWR